MKGDPWTNERIELLTELWTGSTMTASGIAAELGDVTRNAVIGKVHRLGLPARKPGGSTAQAMARGPARNRRTPRRKPKVLAMLPIPEPSGAHRCDLMGLTNASCRWAVTDDSPFLFCGEPEADCVGRQPYCRHHSAMAFWPLSHASKDVRKWTGNWANPKSIIKTSPSFEIEDVA